MKNLRKLTLVVLALMFVFPALIQFGSVNSTASIEPIKYFTESYIHHDQIWIQSNEEFNIQAAAESWAGDGSAGNPYVITGYLFDCETQPLRIWHTTVHWIFIDNEIFGVGGNIQCGTWIENTTNGAIIDNEVHNRHAALAIADVENLIISGNYIHDCWGRGVELFGAMNTTIIQNNIIEDIGQSGIYSVTSRNCIVKNNTISNCVSGITLVGQTTNCTITGNIISNCESTGILMTSVDDGIITDNTITNVEDQGIYLSSPTDCVVTGNIIGDVDGIGFKIANAELSDISENIIANCTEDGFCLTSGANTSLQWNSVYNMTGYAVNLETDSSNFSIKYNTFIDNGVDCQVNDDGTSNIVSQNYYDDWSTPDVDADGYVDSPYALDGDAENQDELPLAVAGVVPTTTVTTTTSTTENPLPMDLLLIAGAIGVIVIVGVVLLVKRR